MGNGRNVNPNPGGGCSGTGRGWCGCPERQWDPQGQQLGQGGAAFPGANHFRCAQLSYPASRLFGHRSPVASRFLPRFSICTSRQAPSLRIQNTITITMVSETYTQRNLPLPARVGLCGGDERQRPRHPNAQHRQLWELCICPCSCDVAHRAERTSLRKLAQTTAPNGS